MKSIHGIRGLKFVLAASVSAASLVAAHTTYAEDVAAAAPPADTGVEVVVVTARKKAEKLQDVPVTVTALTAKAVEKLQIKNIFDLAQVTPGVYYGTSGGRNGGNKLQIRNFSTGTSGPSKASVFIDGVYSPGDYSSMPLANLERIEVLKGPQSAYFGRATFVGAVNFITRDPTDVTMGKFDFVNASLGEHDYTGFMSAPIIKGVLAEQITFRDYSFSGAKKWHTTDGLHLGGQSTRSISSKTVFTPSDDLKLKLYYAHVEDRDEIPPTLYMDLNSRVAITRADGTKGYYFNGPVKYNFSAPNWGLPTTSLTNPGIRHKQDRLSLSYDWKVAGHTVSGFVAHSEEHYNEQLDGNLYLSGTSPEIIPNALGVPTTATFAPSFFNYNLMEKDTQVEIRVTSPQNQPLRYTFGYSYVNVDGHNQLSLAPSKIAIYNANNYGGSFLNPAVDNSIFGGLYWDVNEKITLSAEAREQKEVITAKTYSTAAATFGTTLSSVSATYNAFLPRINAQYRVNRNLQFYALYAIGNNPGGFQPTTPALAAANNIPYNYAEEKIKNSEVGMKSSWYNGRLIFNAALFHMDFTDEQLSQTTPIVGSPTGFVSIYLPGVTSKVDGFEAEVDAAPTNNLQVRGTVGYGKAVYKNFCSTPYAALTGVQTGLNCRSVNGMQQEGTPALQTSLSGDYTHPISGELNFYLRGDWEYQSKVYNEEWDQSWIPAFSTINARMGIENGSWTLEAFVKNATNDSNSTRSTRVTDGRAAAIAGSYAPLGGFSQAIAGEQNIAGTAKKPYQIGVRVGYSF